MVPRPEGQIVEATGVESVPTPALHHRVEKRSASLGGRSSQEVLKEAQQLLVQVLRILSDPVCEEPSSAAWSFRLARAHALTLLDHLARMLDSR
jgi:hypothetical protein